MANGKIKTEMTGTGGGRWNPRAVAKGVSKKLRRRNGIAEIDEQADPCQACPPEGGACGVCPHFRG